MVVSQSNRQKRRTHMKMDMQDSTNDMGLEGLEIEKLELNEFLDDSRLQEGSTISKVMAASCTTCECCCSY
jgi:thiazolylpeptide-type bacteriocin precursor